MASDITKHDGAVLTVIKHDGTRKYGRLEVSGTELKIKKPDGGRGRPAVIQLSDVHSYELDTSQVSKPTTKSNGQGPKVVRKKGSPLSTKPLKVEVAEEADDEEEEEIYTAAPAGGTLLNPRTGKIKLKAPRKSVRRCPMTGAEITRENGVYISLFEDGVKKEYWFDRTDEGLAEFLALIRPDVDFDTAELEAENEIIDNARS